MYQACNFLCWCQNGCVHADYVNKGDTRGERQGFGFLCVNFAEAQKACMVSSPFFPIHQGTFAAILLMVRFSFWKEVLNWFVVLNIILLALPSFLPSLDFILANFLESEDSLSAVVLPFQFSSYSIGPPCPYLTASVFVCLYFRWNFSSLNLRNEKYPQWYRGVFTRTLVCAFPTKISCLTHKKALYYFCVFRWSLTGSFGTCLKTGL